MQVYYGRPSDDEITAYVEEAAILLAGRYLSTVEYGFKKDGKVVFALKYVARSDGTLQTDDRPGRVPYGLNIDGTTWYSYLFYSNAYMNLDSGDQGKVQATLPVNRSSGPNPVTGNGYWEQSRSYSSNGEGVTRNIFRPL